MTFVTTLRLESGDRDALDGVVEEIRSVAEQKGAQLKGPHSHPPAKLSVPLYRRPGEASEEFDRWGYTVYHREVEIVGHDDLARRIAEWDIPSSVRVEVEVDHRAGM